ncbi:MAG: hypothetical protein KDA85_06290, partial [Planctomycetaceae bacterium]|nr:hypothetical protein [Planctomycetaceae bacterium]
MRSNHLRYGGRRHRPVETHRRRGSILPLAGAILVTVFAFAAFTIDFGVITVAKGQMQNAADASAHAAMLELTDALAPGYAAAQSTVAANARERAVEMVGRFRTADQNSTIANADRDIRLGRRSWNEVSGSWVTDWNSTPYNVVEVTVRRTSEVDAAIPLTFARVLGYSDFDIQTKSTASVSPGVGFRLPPQ